MQRTRELYPVNRLEEIHILELPFSYTSLKHWYQSLPIALSDTRGMKSVMDINGDERYLAKQYKKPGFLAQTETLAVHLTPTQGQISKVSIRARKWFEADERNPEIDSALLASQTLAWRKGTGNSLDLVPVGVAYNEPSIATVEYHGESSVDGAEEELVRVGNIVFNQQQL